jgi:hypothetical protein
MPNETMVHNLEHGAIGLLYAPDTDPEDIKTLESIVGEHDHSVFSMPYEGQLDAPIVITAWAHAMELQTAEKDSVNEFIDEFIRGGGDAPEGTSAPECEHQDPEPFEAGAAEGDETELTPSPEPSDGDKKTPGPEPTES